MGHFLIYLNCLLCAVYPWGTSRNLLTVVDVAMIACGLSSYCSAVADLVVTEAEMAADATTTAATKRYLPQKASALTAGALHILTYNFIYCFELTFRRHYERYVFSYNDTL